MLNDIRRRPEGALMRTYLSAAGVAPESISKPLVGIVTSATQVFSERPDARELGSAAASAIEAAGGLAVRWDTVRTPDLMTWGHADSYAFAWRDQLADFIESWARQEALDGLVLVGDDHKTLAGMTMAAARLNLPAIIVTTGPARWPQPKNGDGASKKGLSDPFALLTETLFGRKKTEAGGEAILFTECLLGQNNHAAHGMGLALEALGVCLPGMSTAPNPSPRRTELAKQSAQKVLSLIQNGHGFRRMLTPNAFVNAIRLSAAMGGSIDVAVHLMAVAHEAGAPIALETFDKIARETPQVCRLGGAGEKAPHSLEDLDRAGGVWAVLSAVKAVAPTTTVGGKGAMELAKNAAVRDGHVIAASKPYHRESGVGVLRGNLAPSGALFLLNQVLPTLQRFQGPAAVFENEIDAAKAISEGAVKKGAAIVVRGQGPRGGPGLRKLRVLPALLESRGLNKSMPVITDGRLADRPAGLFISSVSPEGATVGPLAIIRSGDLIDIHIPERRVGVRLTDMELRIRMSRWQAPDNKARRGFLERYSRLVSAANEGAILK